MDADSAASLAASEGHDGGDWRRPPQLLVNESGEFNPTPGPPTAQRHGLPSPDHSTLRGARGSSADSSMEDADATQLGPAQPSSLTGARPRELFHSVVAQGEVPRPARAPTGSPEEQPRQITLGVTSDHLSGEVVGLLELCRVDAGGQHQWATYEDALAREGYDSVADLMTYDDDVVTHMFDKINMAPGHRRPP